MSPQTALDSSLLVVIVNYRTPGLTLDCLKSLAEEVKTVAKTQVIVVDNHSGDDSVPQIQQGIIDNGWEAWGSVIASEHNGGFAYGNNLAIRSALASENPPDYLLLLNPDTIVRPYALKNLIDFMNEHPQVGIAGSRLEHPDGTPQCSAFRFPTLWSELEGGLRLGLVSQWLSKWVVAPPVSEVSCQTDWVCGASMIVRREVFEAIGLLDEEYFMYYEETDFCLQAHRAGLSCWYVPESRVVHLVGQSSGINNTKVPPKRWPQYWFESRQRFFQRNYGKAYTALTDLLWIISFALWNIRRVIQRKPAEDPPYFWRDFCRHSILLKGFFSQSQDSKSSLVEKSSPKPAMNSLSLWQQIQEDWLTHGKDWTKPGFRAVAVQRLGVWRMTIEPKLLRAPLSILYITLYRFICNVYGIELPYTVQLGRRVIIEHHSGIIIHGHSVIGDDCIIRQGVTLGNRYLDRPLEAPQLGKRVNVGAGAKILGNVIIGDDVNIGANAVVLKDIPAGQTAVGIPAKILQPSSHADF